MKKGVSPTVVMTIISIILCALFVIVLFVNGQGSDQMTLGSFSLAMWYMIIASYVVFVLAIIYHYWCKSYEKQLEDDDKSK